MKGLAPLMNEWDWERAEEAFSRALVLTPSHPTSHQWHALSILTPQGRFADARQALERARELDSSSPAILAGRGVISFYSRDFETAIRELEAAIRAHPQFPLSHFFLGQCLVEMQETARGVGCLERALELSSESSEVLAILGHSKAVDGAVETAEALLDRLDQRAGRRYVSPALQAQVLVGLERYDEALDRLEEAATQRATDLIWIAVRPVYDPLRGSGRFIDLVSRVGLGPPG